MARPDGTAGADFAAEASAVLAQWRHGPLGTKPGQFNPLVADALSQATLRTKADVARAYGELIRRVDEEARKLGPAVSAGVRTGRPGSPADPRDPGRPREPGLFPEEPDLLLHVAGRERRLRRQAEPSSIG